MWLAYMFTYEVKSLTVDATGSRGIHVTRECLVTSNERTALSSSSAAVAASVSGTRLHIARASTAVSFFDRVYSDTQVLIPPQVSGQLWQALLVVCFE